jgi:hypothetical protein
MLDVWGDANISSGWQNAQLRITGQTNSNYQLQLGYDTVNNYGSLQAGNAGVGYTTLALNPAGGKVGIGTTSPAQALEVNGQIKVDSLASASATHVCISGSVLSSCSSSIRYKENIKSADFGLTEIEKLRPVTFKWKGRDENDIGFVAEEVAKVDPLFVTYKDGKIEGVKYDQLTAVLANAVKELKSANDNQTKQIESLQRQLADLQHKMGASVATNVGFLSRLESAIGLN